jgi:hypothetical protein
MFGREKKKHQICGWMDGSAHQHPEFAATIKTKEKLYINNIVTVYILNLEYLVAYY